MTIVQIPKTLALGAMLAGCAVVAANAFATPTTWQQNHPRRVEVNQRLANQDRRIHNEVKSGEITKAQATALHQEDHAIRQEERDMASMNGSHLTKADQRSLNQQENAVSRQIGH